MKGSIKTTWIAALIACLFVGYGFSHGRVEDSLADIKYKLHVAAIPVPDKLIRALAGEFKGLFADYLLLEAASFNGSQESFGASSEDWDAVARLLKQSNILDPYFRSTYMLAHTTLSWRAQKHDDALAILKNSKEHLPLDWIPGFYMGFTHFYFLKDNLSAAKELMSAARIPDSPSYLSTMAGRLAVESGQIDVAIGFLTIMYEKSEEEENRKQIRERIQALQGVKILQDAVHSFQFRYERMPNKLEELVSSEILSAIPDNPYHRPYTLKEGKVKY